MTKKVNRSFEGCNENCLRNFGRNKGLCRGKFEERGKIPQCVVDDFKNRSSEFLKDEMKLNDVESLKK